MYAWIIWAIVTLIALLIEVLTLGFAVICFAVGAIVACIVAFAGGGVVLQLALFSITTLISLVAVRPFVIRYLKRSNVAPTNADALVGRKAIVTQEIRGGVGRASVDGDDWKVGYDGEDIVEVGKRVEIVSVESVILIVKKV